MVTRSATCRRRGGMRRAATAPRLRATDRRRINAGSTRLPPQPSRRHARTRLSVLRPERRGLPRRAPKALSSPRSITPRSSRPCARCARWACPHEGELAAQADAYTVLGLRGIDGMSRLRIHAPRRPCACASDARRGSYKTEQLSFGEQCHALLRNLVLTRAALPEPWESRDILVADRRRRPRFAALRGQQDATATPCWWTRPRGISPRAPTRWEPRERPSRPLSPGFRY